MYKILFTSKSKKFLKKLDKKVRERIILGVDKLRFRPERYLKKMVNEPAYRMKIGDYRVIVDVIHEEIVILVIKIEHRKMEANFKALAVAKAKGNRKRMKRMLVTSRGRTSQLNIAKTGTIRKRGRPRKMK